MSKGFSLEEEALFHRTSETVLKRLRKTRDPGDLLAVLRGAYGDFDRAYASAPAAAREAVACHAGCDACCHELVAVQAHEVLIAAEYIQARFSPAELDAVIARAGEHRDAFLGRSSAEQAAFRLPCPLLREGHCTIY